MTEMNTAPVVAPRPGVKRFTQKKGSHPPPLTMKNQNGKIEPMTSLVRGLPDMKLYRRNFKVLKPDSPLLKKQRTGNDSEMM